MLILLEQAYFKNKALKVLFNFKTLFFKFRSIASKPSFLSLKRNFKQSLFLQNKPYQENQIKVKISKTYSLKGIYTRKSFKRIERFVLNEN